MNSLEDDFRIVCWEGFVLVDEDGEVAVHFDLNYYS